MSTAANRGLSARPAGAAAPIIVRTPLPTVEVTGQDHVLSHVNPAFCALLGKTKTELLGQPFAGLVPADNACLPILDQVSAMESHSDEAEREVPQSLYSRWPAREGKRGSVAVLIQVAKPAPARPDATGLNEALLIAGLRQHELTEAAEASNTQLQVEIDERKRTQASLHESRQRLANQAEELERLVAERTAELRESTRELEAFSYSIAHDMREPLRGMRGYAQILLADHAAQLTATGQNYLEQIAKSAARMDTLIQEVLNYTGVQRGQAVLTRIDLDRFTRDIIAIYPDWQPPKAEIEVIGTLPAVLGHEGLLTQCISNLLSNAVKFVRPGVVPRIRIRAEKAPGPHASPTAISAGSHPAEKPMVRLWFENNGIGIAPKDRDRLFRMFERLNARSSYEGSGVGLTIVRKAIERMGGQVDFESESGQGSRFWLELEAAPAL